MTDKNATVHKHLTTAREHLAGVKAAREWIQQLAGEQLLDSQQPIRNTPYPGPPAPDAGKREG